TRRIALWMPYVGVFRKKPKAPRALAFPGLTLVAGARFELWKRPLKFDFLLSYSNPRETSPGAPRFAGSKPRGLTLYRPRNSSALRWWVKPSYSRHWRSGTGGERKGTYCGLRAPWVRDAG